MARKTKKTEVETPVVAAPAMDLDSFMSEINAVSDVLGTQAAAAELEAALRAQEKAEAEAQAKADAPPAVEEVIEQVADEPVVLPHVSGDIKELIGAVTIEQRKQKAAEVLSEVQTRYAHDTAHGRTIGAGTANSFKKAEKELASIGAAGFFVAADIDPSFINRSIAGDKRFNIYAVDKIAEIVRAIDGGFLQNPIIRCVLLSMFNCRDAGVPFTKNAMEAAISGSIKVEDRSMTKHLVRHTVKASTAPTQTSQMRHALTTLGIATRSVAGRNTEVFTLTDTPTTRRLEQVLRAA